MATKKSLLAQAKALTVADRPFSPLQPTQTIVVAIADLDQIAEKAEKQFPSAVLNEKAIIGAGKLPSGDACVPFALKQKVPNGTMTVYSNGKVVLVGAFTALDLAAE